MKIKILKCEIAADNKFSAPHSLIHHKAEEVCSQEHNLLS